MKKVNFKEIIIKDINDNNIVTDFQKQLGNQLYMQGQNIEECELGKKIYFTPDDESTELDDKEVAIIRKAVHGIQPKRGIPAAGILGELRHLRQPVGCWMDRPNFDSVWQCDLRRPNTPGLMLYECQRKHTKAIRTDAEPADDQHPNRNNHSHIHRSWHRRQLWHL